MGEKGRTHCLPWGSQCAVSSSCLSCLNSSGACGTGTWVFPIALGMNVKNILGVYGGWWCASCIVRGLLGLPGQAQA